MLETYFSTAREHELVSDALVRAALGHELEHLSLLAGREHGEGVVVTLPREASRR